MFLKILEKKKRLLQQFFWRFSCKRQQNGFLIRIQISSLLQNTLTQAVREAQPTVSKERATVSQETKAIKGGKPCPAEASTQDRWPQDHTHLQINIKPPQGAAPLLAVSLVINFWMVTLCLVGHHVELTIFLQIVPNFPGRLQIRILDSAPQNV